MRIKISTYFFALLVVSICILITKNLVFGLTYATALLPIVCFILLVRSRADLSKVPILIASFSIFTFYYIRPLVLGYRPEFFKYGNLGIISTESQVLTLLYIAGFSTMFLSALLFSMTLAGSPNKRPMQFFRLGLIYKLRYLFLLFLLGIVGIWSILTLGFNVGVKGVHSSFNVIQFALPVTLLIPVSIGYLTIRAIRPVTFIEKTMVFISICAMLFITLMRGSKAGAFLLLLYLFVFILFMRGDLRIKLSRVALYATSGSLFIVVTVMMANIIRFQGIMGLQTLSYFYDKVPDLWFFVIDSVTVRFNGYDGMLATLMKQPEGLNSVVPLKNIFMGAVAKLIPGYNYSGLSVGKAVGVYYGGRSLDAEYAGALGLFGILNFMYGMLGGMLASGIMGSFFGLWFRWLDKLSIGGVEKTTFLMVLCYQMALWLSSGNFDDLIQKFVITISHAVIYYFVMYMVVNSVKKTSMNNYSNGRPVSTLNYP